MELQQKALTALRERVAGLRAPSCGMAHESIPSGPDGKPLRSTRSPSGFGRAGICADAIRAVHLGCSHTMARNVLRHALTRLSGKADLLAELHDIEEAISVLDHRRYDAESRRATAIHGGAGEAIALAERDIADLVVEHGGYVARVAEVREETLRRIDDALSAARAG